MLPGLLIRLIVIAGAFVVTAWLLGGMELSGGFWGTLWVSILFGIVNAIVGTVLRILTFPLTVLTLGLFSIVVNALVLKLTDALTDQLSIDDFWWTAIWAAIIISIVSMVLDRIVRSVVAPDTA